MEKQERKTPRSKSSEDTLNGHFISPLEDSDSLQKMESTEAKMLAPPRVAARFEIGDEGSPPPKNEEDAASIKNTTPSSDSQAELAMMRFARELKSIRQDLLSIKQHFEAMKKPQDSQKIDQQSGLKVDSLQDNDTAQLLNDLRTLLLYLDRLLESLPEEKIEEFANSEYFNLYQHVFEKLGLS